MFFTTQLYLFTTHDAEDCATDGRGLWVPVLEDFMQEVEQHSVVDVDLVHLVEDVIHHIAIQDALTLQRNHVFLK